MTLLIALALATSLDTLPAGPYAQLDRALDSLSAEYGLPGLAAAVVADGEIVFERGYGYADVEAQRPVTAATPFRIASLTKPIAATAMLQLVERGELDLDRPFTAYVPGWDEACQFFKSAEVLAAEPILVDLTEDWRCETEGERLTVRRYLTHTAQGEPGAAYRYNGFLYGQLFRVVEAVTERPFGELLRDRLFVPLGMSRTLPSQADSSNVDVLTALAQPYKSEGGRSVRSEYPQPFDLNAGAGIVSTVVDLARFDIALSAGELLADTTLAAAMSPARSTTTGEALPYGMGWFVQEVEGERVVWHYGWQPGSFSGLWVRLPGRGVTLILLANSDGLSAPFELGEGDVTRSAFAAAFMGVVGR